MLTACLVGGAFVLGAWFGADCVKLSARERVGLAERARDRAIAAYEGEQAEAAYWRDVAATPAALNSGRRT